MDWQKNRLFIGALVLVAIGGLAIWAIGARSGDTPDREADRASDFPDLERDQIATIEITRPEDDGQAVRLERREDQWFITAPIEVPADQSAVSTVLDKLDELEVTGIAASNPEFHERLEVDAEHGVHVVARGADGEALADLWLGAYRAPNTLVRLEGQDEVVQVRGSIKFAFNKALREWRDRSILTLEADDLREVAWTGPNGTFRFVRGAPAPAAEGEEAPSGPGEWEMAEVSYVPAPEAPAAAAEGETPPPAPPAAPADATPLTTIEGFQPSKVRSMVASLARMRASDFAAPDVTPESAGFGPSSPRVTLTLPPPEAAPAEGEEAARTHTVILGNEASAESHDFYAMREGDPTIFVVSRFLGERVHPTATSFTQSAPAAPPEGEGGAPEADAMPGMPGGGQLPPEVMEQIRRQLEQQGLGGGAGP